MLFLDRTDAGRRLALAAVGRRGLDPLVLALSRGGVPVAEVLATAFGAELDVFFVRDLPLPGFPEVRLGAIAEGGGVFIDAHAMRDAGTVAEQLEQIAERESAELARAMLFYRGAREPPVIAGRTVFLVDDVLTSPGRALAAVHSLRERGPHQLVLAAPAIAQPVLDRLRGEVDALLYVRALEEIGSPDDWYDLSSEPSEHELIALLGRSRARPPAASADVDIPCGSDALSGTLVVPAAARAAVIFAHTEAGSCICPRDLQVARALRNAGMATLLFEMLSPRESASDEAAGQLRSDIDVLAQRLVLAAEWVRDRPQTRGLRIGCFGANAGATAALTAAARRPGLLEALVCCRGRPDLVAASDLVRVRAPTLLLVGGRDLPGLELNRDAAQLLRVEHELSAVPHAAHLFEEPGVLEEVGNRSVAWFARAFEPAAAAA